VGPQSSYRSVEEEAEVVAHHNAGECCDVFKIITNYARTAV